MVSKKDDCADGKCTKKVYKDYVYCKKHYVDIHREKTKTDDNGILIKFCTRCFCYVDESTFRNKYDKPTERCGACILKVREIEARRAPRDRTEEKKAYEQKEETKELRKQWREENNGKMNEYKKEYRKKERNKDEKEYLQKNAKYMREYRVKKYKE